MINVLYVGDHILTQIGLGLDERLGDNCLSDRILSDTSHDLGYLGINRKNLSEYNRIIYSMGYGDVTRLSKREFHGFKDRVEQDIIQLLSHGIRLLFLIPQFPVSSEEDIDKEFYKIVNETKDIIDYLIEKHSLQYIDLNEILISPANGLFDLDDIERIYDSLLEINFF